MLAILSLLLIACLFSTCDRTVAGLPAPASTPMRPAIRVGVNHFSLRRITIVRPKMPEAARQLGVKGPVILEIKIDQTGNVADVRVVRGNPILNSAAKDAVKQWKYEPISLKGQPIAVWSTVVVDFNER